MFAVVGGGKPMKTWILNLDASSDCSCMPANLLRNFAHYNIYCEKMHKQVFIVDIRNFPGKFSDECGFINRVLICVEREQV